MREGGVGLGVNDYDSRKVKTTPGSGELTNRNHRFVYTQLITPNNKHRCTLENIRPTYLPEITYLQYHT